MGIETKFVKQIEEIYYGTSVESGILSDPFRLMEVPGIRFPKIDRIYRKTSNYDPINPRRLKYGVVYALEESKNVKESMYLLQSEIGSYILQELEIPKTEKTKQAVKNTVSELTFT